MNRSLAADPYVPRFHQWTAGPDSSRRALGSDLAVRRAPETDAPALIALRRRFFEETAFMIWRSLDSRMRNDKRTDHSPSAAVDGVLAEAERNS